VRSLLPGDTPDGTLRDIPVLRLDGKRDGFLLDPTILHAQLLIDVQAIRVVAPNLRRKTSLPTDRSEH
jgi:hypothetical protein